VYEPTDIEIRREVAAARMASLRVGQAWADGDTPVTRVASAARRVVTPLVAGLRPARRRTPGRPAIEITPLHTEAPDESGTPLARCA
jgi:hypothetical protein